MFVSIITGSTPLANEAWRFSNKMTSAALGAFGEVGCSFIGKAFDDNWGLPDPTGQSDAVFIEVIQQIENKIRNL